ncbi:YfhO family protein [Bacteroides ihuae]|uniref:YfhO family protein n=1 Tax=Bacteroides ihuae TaxID=1852362 RepID=UPI0008DB2BEA|nr:YfhO family protein [Bacteroides ihuae]
MKKFLPDLIVILSFIAISFVYFFPAITEDRILFQHDTAAGAGAGQEAKEYNDQTGERTRWTNSIFGGMPTYQISPSYDSTETLRVAEKAYHLFLPNYVWLTFVMMLGFYILLRALGISPWLAGLGGIIWAFSSYFFILISAGHIWKFITLAYIPPTIAGIVLAYRKQYLLGGVITALFLALQILSNHVQMSYYFLFLILLIVGAFFEESWRKKELPHFFKATGILVIAGIIGISANLSNLYHTYEYSKETMRGKSELKAEGDAAKQTSSGLDRDYITQWSYGIGETFSLLVPNIKGGASVPLSQNEKVMEKANPMYSGIYSQLTQYFGDQPGTSGPVYVGAFVLMLFILGLFIVDGPMKWALAGATLLSILLAWGRNFMGFTDFFIDYIPMYNKFRAVSSALVIAEFTIPLLAILTLKEIFDRPQILKEKIKYLYLSFGLTGGFALLFALAPRLFFSTFVPTQELKALQQAIPGDQLSPLLSNLEEMRVYLITSDAWRSFFIIAIGTALLLAYSARKLKATWTIAAIAVLCLGDMWMVNKRYLNDEQFVSADQQTEAFSKTTADELILQDSTLDYRVLNFATNTFNENNTAYWHKSVGGYHAAKLRRYQEMIDHHITKEMQAAYNEIATAQGKMDSVNGNSFRVLNMLNTKYFIFPSGKGKVAPIENPYAYGNAWFVGNVRYVNTANEEIEAIDSVLLTETAIVDASFKDKLKGITNSYKDSLSAVRLTNYKPNHLVYETSSSKDGIVVFSEIYYPGWTATIDGKPAEIARANYILRAMNIPAGKHTIEMAFDPKSIHVTESIAYAGLALLLVGIILLLLKYRKNFDLGKK